MHTSSNYLSIHANAKILAIYIWESRILKLSKPPLKNLTDCIYDVYEYVLNQGIKVIRNMMLNAWW